MYSKSNIGWVPKSQYPATKVGLLPVLSESLKDSGQASEKPKLMMTHKLLIILRENDQNDAKILKHRSDIMMNSNNMMVSIRHPLMNTFLKQQKSHYTIQPFAKQKFYRIYGSIFLSA